MVYWKNEILKNGLKYHIITYGCQMNEHESEKIAGILEELGYRPAQEKEEADFILFNTCCCLLYTSSCDTAYASGNRYQRDSDLCRMVGGTFMGDGSAGLLVHENNTDRHGFVFGTVWHELGTDVRCNLYHTDPARCLLLLCSKIFRAGPDWWSGQRLREEKIWLQLRSKT